MEKRKESQKTNSVTLSFLGVLKVDPPGLPHGDRYARTRDHLFL